MTAKYWIAKYVDDVFRNEPINVGVVVSLAGQTAARFVGEREDGVFDGRKLGAKFSVPNVYTQWRNYWRDALSKGALLDVIESKTANYFVVSGGEVSDTGTDSVQEVCRFLFSMLISDGGVIEAYQFGAEDSAEQSLSAEIVELFLQRELLAHDHQLFVRHPIQRDETVRGKHVTHTPSFTQRNGLLSVMEYIDLARPKQKHVKERAGWMGYMFSDIKQADPAAKTYSIIRPAGTGGEVDYAKSLLGSESQMVNWLDDQERGRFLEERRQIADSV